MQPGLVQHSVGWPLDSRTYGGSFVYHLNDDRAYVGFVTGLDYVDPRFFPFEAFQQFKHHPEMHAFLQGRRNPLRRRAHASRPADGSPCRSSRCRARC